ncbi:YSIRK-type signal peptide-containing protein [Jeotgalicoccus marinus]|uniref:YSIRK-type signal peptide-containing protein n=1 Tax=Jeotgalicoccus marinus TaxID=516700 RepID=UPI000411FC5D|nr:YSIRK-type signal peptide-containing protein [Jeotgalicoccus marinus]
MKNRKMNKHTNVNQVKQRFSIRKYKKSVSSVMVGMFLIFGFSFDTYASEKNKVDGVQTEERTETENQDEEDQTNEAELVEQEEALLTEQENAAQLITELENISDENKTYYLGEVEVASDIETVQIILEEAIVEDEAIYQEILKEEQAKKAEAERLKAEEAAKKQAEKEAAQKAEAEEAEQEAKEIAEKEQAEQEEAERKEKEEVEEEENQQDQNQKQDNDESESEEDIEEDEVEDEQSEQDTDTENDDSENRDDVEEKPSETDNAEETYESKEPVEKQEEVKEEVVEEQPEQNEVPEEPVTEPVQPEEEIVEKAPKYIEPEQPVVEKQVEEEVEIEKQPPVNFQKGVSDAYKKADDKAQLEKHLTNVVNTTFKMNDTEAFIKSLDVNLEDLTPEEFTYMLLKYLSENIDAKSVVVTRDDSDDVIIAEGIKDLSKDLDQAKDDSKNNLSMMFYLDNEERASYQHQIDQAIDHSQITAIMMVANAFNNMNMPDFVEYGNHPSQNTKSILNNDIEVSPSVKSLSLNNEKISGIKELNYVPFELTSERVSDEATYKIQVQIDERLAQHVTAMTVHPHQSFITKPFKRLVNDNGQLTNVWQIDYDRLFSSEDDTYMTAKNGLIMLEESIESILSHYNDLDSNPLTYQSAVINEDTGNLIDSTVERNII